MIVAGANGLAGADLVQMAMVFSGVATLIQTVTIGPVGARVAVIAIAMNLALPEEHAE